MRLKEEISKKKNEEEKENSETLNIREQNLIKNEKNHSENQFSKEISNLITHNKVVHAFSLAVGDVPTSIEESFFSPEIKYFYLRANQWKYQIPLEFFKNLFIYFVRDEIKTASIPKSNFIPFLIEKHDQLIDICSILATSEFKQMEPTLIANDEILRSYLEEDLIVSDIQPIKIHKKIKLNKDLEIKKDDFNSLLKNNLDKLKEEFGEEEINLELIEKMRKRTNEIKNKIFALFQN